ncbi:MAG: lipopolysaccharide transport periplasmic protein LptA [Alphaproteobacteria bacterium]|nr:lipopolysaccharide transport periplasmic protein LptA [Alphaproteobacteria bacterium]
MTRTALIAAFAFVCSSPIAFAQTPNPFSGMGRDSDKPIAIAADTTTADLRSETATYAGNVRVTQGDLKLRSDTLSIKAAKGTISRIEAKGNVVLASPQGQATGATATYDIAQREVRMGGKVVLAQGQNILRGTSLVINLATGRAALSGQGGTSGRVEGVFVPLKNPKMPAIVPKPAGEEKPAETKPSP